MKNSLFLFLSTPFFLLFLVCICTRKLYNVWNTNCGATSFVASVAFWVKIAVISYFFHPTDKEKLSVFHPVSEVELCEHLILSFHVSIILAKNKNKQKTQDIFDFFLGLLDQPIQMSLFGDTNMYVWWFLDFTSHVHVVMFITLEWLTYHRVVFHACSLCWRGMVWLIDSITWFR